MSPRHKKPRNCGCELKGKAYKPAGIPMSRVEKVVMYRDELEALKLCDKDGLTQEEAGRKMGVSRGTVQRILTSARGKVADALSGCKAIVLEEVICKGLVEKGSKEESEGEAIRQVSVKGGKR